MHRGFPSDPDQLDLTDCQFLTYDHWRGNSPFFCGDTDKSSPPWNQEYQRHYLLVFNGSLVKVCYLLFIALMPSPVNMCTFGNFGHQILSISLLLYTRPCGNAVWFCFSKDDGKKLQVVGTPDACLLDKADICTRQLSAAPATLDADPFICIVKFQCVMVSAGSSVFLSLSSYIGVWTRNMWEIALFSSTKCHRNMPLPLSQERQTILHA